jgi:hypothetical protein
MGTAAVETEAHNRFVRALIEHGLGIDEIFARDQRATLDQVGDGGIVGGIENFRLRWRPIVDRLGHGNGGVHHVEGEPCGLVEERLQALRIGETRNLNDDAIVALALDQRLRRAQFIDATPHNFHGLIDGR